MKSLFLVLLMAISLITTASGPCSYDTTADPEQCEILQQISDKIGNDSAVAELGLNGEANITFYIDENETVHVEKVEANDFLTEFHIRQTLEGLKMEVSDSVPGKVFSTIVKFVQSH